MQASPVRASPRQNVYATVGDLPRYRKRIVDAIKANPGMRDCKLSSVLEADYGLAVHNKALKKYCDDNNLWSIKPDAPTPSRVLSGKRKIGEAMGRSQDDCWSYTTEIHAVLKDAPDAGRRAIAAELKSTYAITIAEKTLGRWLKLHRDALLAGTLERPMLDDDGKPEDYADEIACILKAEPSADYKPVCTELKRLYRVVVSHRRMRTYLDTLDLSLIHI